MVVEVGPRDGLQNEPAIIPTDAKVRFVDALSDAGLATVEVTSFVSPKAIPQLADAEDVLRSIRRRSGVRYPVLVPNERGFDRALAAGAEAIALFTAATEAFAQANVRATIDETFERFSPVVQRAKPLDIWIRGYVSVAFHCPYSGPVQPDAGIEVARRLFELGCDEVSVADTIGWATPDEVDRFVSRALRTLPVERLALHFHDTGGTALANVDAALAQGVAIFDASAGGLGGCPFAPGAPGNLATESLLDALHERGIETGVDRAAVAGATATLRAAMLPTAEAAP